MAVDDNDDDSNNSYSFLNDGLPPGLPPLGNDTCTPPPLNQHAPTQDINNSQLSMDEVDGSWSPMINDNDKSNSNIGADENGVSNSEICENDGDNRADESTTAV